MYAGFRAGVKPGGLTTDYEVKLLLLYMLKESGGTLLVEHLLNSISETENANYFEVTNAACLLTESGMIAVSGQGWQTSYHLTAQGREALESIGEDKLPFTVRESVMEAVRLQEKRSRWQGNAFAKATSVEHGFQMTLCIRDRRDKLLETTVLLPTMEICRQVESRFLDNPALFYKGVVALMTGTYKYMGALLDEEP